MQKNTKMWLFGLGCIGAALLIFFVIPVEALRHDGGKMRLGSIFVTLEDLLSEHTARYYFALPFALFGYAVLRSLFKKDE